MAFEVHYASKGFRAAAGKSCDSKLSGMTPLRRSALATLGFATEGSSDGPFSGEQGAETAQQRRIAIQEVVTLPW